MKGSHRPWPIATIKTLITCMGCIGPYVYPKYVSFLSLRACSTRLAPQVRSYVYMYTYTLIICSSYVTLIGVHEMHGQVHPINDM